MRHRRPSRSYGKRKAPAGAYSDRYGSRLVRNEAPVAGAADLDGPWIKDFPGRSHPAVTLPNGTVVRRS